MQSLEAEVEDLQDTLDKDAIEEGRLDALKEGLEEAKEELTTHEASFGDSVIAVDKAREMLRTIREQMKAIDDEIAEIQAKINKAETKKARLSERRETALRAKNLAFAEIEQVKRAQEDAQKRRDDVAETVDVFIGEASRICPRVPVDRGETYGTLEKKMEKLEADLKRAESQ